MGLATKKLNILHAEDDKNVFESCRQSILKAFDKAVLPEPIIENVSFCGAIYLRIIEMKKEKKVYDVLLLDLELADKSEYNGINAIDSIIDISPHTKIFVLSGNIYDILYYKKLQEYQEAGKIAGFFETGNHREWCEQLINLVMAKTVGILHFSDMHISAEDNSEQILSGITAGLTEKVDLLIFSGDVANQGRAEEFDKAKTLLTGLCDTLKIKKNVYVPGNHDIKRDAPPRQAFFDFLNFRKAMDEYSGDDLEAAWSYPDVESYADYLNIVKVYPDLRTIVCGLNSAACTEDAKFGYSYGEITAEQLRLAEEKLRTAKDKYPNYLVIGTFHHNIFEPPYYFDAYNKGNEIKWIPPVKKQGLILKKCFENEMNLLLIGHSHVSSSYSLISHDYGNGTPLHILSAGLFSEKGTTPLEPELTVNYLSYQIDLSGNISNMHCQPYSLKLTDGHWKKKQGFYLGLSAN